MKIGFFSGSKKSQILILVLVVMAVILTLGVGLLIHSRSFRSASRIQVDAYKANCLAKSGINIGESFIDIDPCNPAVITMDETYSLGEGTIDVEIASTLANNVLSGTITSTGSSGKSTRVLEKTFNLPAPEQKPGPRLMAP